MLMTASTEVCGLLSLQISVNVPVVNATRKYDPEQKKKVVKSSPNDNFVKQV